MSGGCGDSGMSSPAGPYEDSGSREWRRIYDRVEALLPQVENSLRARLVQAEASRKRWKDAYIELPLLANPKIIELKENDLKYYRTCEDDDNSQLKEAGSNAELIQNNEGHEGIAGELRAELRKLKQAHETIISNKDKEIYALLGVKDFLWNQLRTIDKENMALLKIKEVEAAQATEAAQKLQQHIDELQVAAQKLQHNIEELQVSVRDKDDKVGRLQAETVNAEKRVLILDRKRLKLRSLVKEKNNEIQKLKNEVGQKRRKTAYGLHLEDYKETSQECSEDIDKMDREEYTEPNQDCSKDIDEMDLEEYTCSTNDSSSKDLVGQRIKVWWPCDKKYYEGVVKSYDSAKKLHKVLYKNRDVEQLNMAMEKWKRVESNGSPIKCSTDDSSSKDLVGQRIKVWWHDDKKYYEGVVKSYDSAKKLHKVLYKDGDVEHLNMAMEKWKRVESNGSPIKQKKDPLKRILYNSYGAQLVSQPSVLAIERSRFVLK